MSPFKKKQFHYSFMKFCQLGYFDVNKTERKDKNRAHKWKLTKCIIHEAGNDSAFTGNDIPQV